jgi:hypothetical protein
VEKLAGAKADGSRHNKAANAEAGRGFHIGMISRRSGLNTLLIKYFFGGSLLLSALSYPLSLILD